jgi:hypothetical protein
MVGRRGSIRSDLKLAAWMEALAEAEDVGSLDVISYQESFSIVSGRNGGPRWKLVPLTIDPSRNNAGLDPVGDHREQQVPTQMIGCRSLEDALPARPKPLEIAISPGCRRRRTRPRHRVGVRMAPASGLPGGARSRKDPAVMFCAR